MERTPSATTDGGPFGLPMAPEALLGRRSPGAERPAPVMASKPVYPSSSTDWLKDAVIMEISVRTCADGNGAKIAPASVTSSSACST